MTKKKDAKMIREIASGNRREERRLRRVWATMPWNVRAAGRRRMRRAIEATK